MKRRYKIMNGFLMVIGIGLTTLAITLSYNSDCPPPSKQVTGEASMQAIVYQCYGASDVLQLQSVAKPVPKDNEVLIKVRAAGVNPLDWHYMRGQPYIMRLGSGIGAPEDTKMGVDYAGIVEAVGKDVSQFQVGDEVFGGRGGAFGEYLTVPENRGITLKPDNVTFEQAAGVPIAALTALQALREQGNIQSGQRVLINGASGGVGTYAVQIAKYFGAEVTGVCSTRNVAMVQSIGADHVIDYKKENYIDSAEPFDLIVDMVGNFSLSENRRVLKESGTLVIVGGAKGNWLGPLVTPIKSLIVSPFVEQELKFFIAEVKQEDLIFLADLMRQEKLTTVIDRTYSLADVPKAVTYSEAGHASGKIIVTVN